MDRLRVSRCHGHLEEQHERNVIEDAAAERLEGRAEEAEHSLSQLFERIRALEGHVERDERARRLEERLVAVNGLRRELDDERLTAHQVLNRANVPRRDGLIELPARIGWLAGRVLTRQELEGDAGYLQYALDGLEDEAEHRAGFELMAKLHRLAAEMKEGAG